MKHRLLFSCIASLLLSFSEGQRQPADLSSGSNPCVSKQSCGECIRTPTCAWCAQPNYTTIDGSSLPRCNQEHRFYGSQLPVRCELPHIVNPATEYSVKQDLSLSKAREGKEAVQIRPQRISLKLRIHEAYSLFLQYAQAEDYPVDLYYLMDLSKSMEDDKDKLSELGLLLAERMQNITSNFRLGFGSFVDKVLMPYVSTVPANLLEPCPGCAAPYGYHNVMPLSLDTGRFANEVKRAAVSGNLDAPEGGFDAIMQAVVCKEQIAWRDRARRLLVFSTDAGFHYAGDGKLGGVVKPNDGKCHLEEGRYTHSTVQDYPSVSQINQKVKENSINLIFAVTADQLPVYEQLGQQVEGAFAGKLDQDSSNVVELVKEQYDKITSVVELKDNATSHVRVTYFSSCLSGGAPVQTNKCDGLKVGTVVNFTAKIEAISCPTDPEEWNQLLQIYPVGINESLILDLELLCNCDCERPGNDGFREEASECNGSGTLKCGVCECDDTHFGRMCECDNNDAINVVDSEAGCRPDNTTDILCSDRGACICGECQCYARSNPSEIVSGPFCECDNFLCENNNGMLCSGPEHGACVCGECQCLPGWTGSDCSCRASTDTCMPPRGGEICSGKGECKCGTCQCIEDDQGRYSGKFCEECPTCPGKCMEYKACVQCQVFNSGELKGDDCRNCTFVPISVDVAQPENDDERLCTFFDDDNCRFTFVYGYGDSGETVVRVQKTKECPPILDILGIVLGVVGAIVAVGFALLLIWKLLTTIHDRREFARFEKERQMAKWDTGENPIYKQATSTFKNPTYGGK